MAFMQHGFVSLLVISKFIMKSGYEFILRYVNLKEYLLFLFLKMCSDTSNAKYTLML